MNVKKQRSMRTHCFFLFLLFLAFNVSSSCDQVDRDSLLSFYQHVLSSPPLNWSSTIDCCRWEGITCTSVHAAPPRVTHLSLAGRGLSGTFSNTNNIISNLSFLSYFNLSRNHLSGPLPHAFLPPSIRAVDLSSNRFNGSIDHSLFFHQASNLVTLNVSNNSFTGPIPSSIICTPLLAILDFSSNQFTGDISPGIGHCSNLRVFRAGFNSLSGYLPYDLYGLKTLTEISLPNNRFTGPINDTIVSLSGLTVLELHVNGLTGQLPANIGRLSNLEQLQLHTNSLNGTLPPSLAHCSNLTTLLLRNNLFGGDISALDFSKLQRLQAIDLGNNTFSGNIPASLCLCRSLTAVRLAYNGLTGQVPPCMASLKSLAHLSLSDNYLSDVVGTLKILTHCDDLAVIFMSRCFRDEKMPDDYDLMHLDGFRNLQILALGGCGLEGQIPSWIAKLRKLKVLNLSYNRVSGPIPTWLADMPGLFVLNLTQNYLSGDLPRELGRMPGLIADNTSSDLSYLALPFLFDSQQYDRLFNLPRGLKVGNNSLTGNIPAEIGQLKLLHVLDLSNNGFNGSIPVQLAGLVNLEKLDLSGNNLSGEIPAPLTGLHFLSSFSVANNDLQGEIPKGGQFDTFPAASFEGNHNLCGDVLQRNCLVTTQTDIENEDEEADESSTSNIPFGMGYFVGFFAVSITLLFHCSWTRSGPYGIMMIDDCTLYNNDASLLYD